MKIVGAMFREKLIDMLTAKRDNKKEKIDWFGVTKERVRKLAKEKRYKDTVLAQHTRVDEEGRTVPAFNYDYAIHQYFEDKEIKERRVITEEDILYPKRAK